MNQFKFHLSDLNTLLMRRSFVLVVVVVVYFFIFFAHQFLIIAP